MGKILISPSKIMMYNECPKKLEFKYVMGIPQDDHDYFQIGKDVEACLMELINNKPHTFPQNIFEMANALYQNIEFRAMIDGKTIQYQKEYKNDEINGFSDIETDDIIIDVKTSSTKWNRETIQKYKYQAKMYLKYSGKKIFYFLVLNKKTLEVQCLKVTTDNFKDLEEKIYEIKLAFEMGAFPKKEGFHCTRCDYRTLCKNIS